MFKLTETQIRWFRLRRSGLVDPFDSPEASARALAGVQAQILPTAAHPNTIRILFPTLTCRQLKSLWSSIAGSCRRGDGQSDIP